MTPSDAICIKSHFIPHTRGLKITISSENLTVLCRYYITIQFCSCNKEHESLIKF